MSIASLIIGLFLLSICFLPIVWFHVSRNRKQKRVTREFMELGEKFGLKISEFDTWNTNYFIGIDHASNTVLYFRKQLNTDITERIDLNKVSKCSKVNSTVAVNSPSGKSNVLQRLQLEITYRAASSSKYLEFYDADKTTSVSDEMILIDKWVSLLNKRVKVKDPVRL